MGLLVQKTEQYIKSYSEEKTDAYLKELDKNEKYPFEKTEKDFN